MGNFAELVGRFVQLLDLLVLIIIGLALIYFIWGLIGYVYHSGNETKRKESIQYMIWGIIGLFVMVSFWSFVYIVADLIGADAGVPFISS